MVFKFNEWFGENKTLVIEGKVIDSYRKIRRKQKVPDFYLDIKDSLTGKKYKFKVKRRIYELMVAGAKFKKEFRVGSYGIIYRKYP